MSAYVPEPEVIGKVVGQAIREATAPLLKRIAALEQAIEGRGLKFMGKFNRAVTYEKSDMTTYAGSIWIAARRTTDAPGSCSDWVKMLTSDKRGLSTED
jgi:hypothetical protein